MNRILIIDDDIAFGQMIRKYLMRNAYQVDLLYTASEIVTQIKNNSYDLVLTDLRMPDLGGFDVVRLVRNHTKQTKVIVMTGYADIRTAIQSIKQGAYNYISKPFPPDELLNMIGEALSSQNQDDNQRDHAPKPSLKPRFMEGKGRASLLLKKHIELVAPSPMSVLILGESGTGKEHIARLIHEKSTRSDKPFVAVDCGAIPKELVASEFFGHVKGSFTGAATDKIGYFEAADGGTLFLDEVGNLAYDTQIQLLRALQERKVKPVGGTQEKVVDVRIVAATNEDLKQAQQSGDFREDLYHRLNEFQIEVPSIRERGEDVMAFANFFLDQANAYLSRDVQGFGADVGRAFESYNWPGNLREMKNVINRAVLLASGDQVGLGDIPEEIYKTKPKEDRFTLHSETNQIELIKSALEDAGYNKSKAAKLLGIDRKTLYNKLKQYQINFPVNEN